MKMLIKEAAQLVEKRLGQFQNNLDKQRKAEDYLQDRFDFPSGRFADYYTKRLPASEITEDHKAVLFYLTDAIDYVNGNNKLKETIFTDVEISNFYHTKFYIPKAEFPLRIKCIKVTDDQWIGVTNVQFLMNLRASQLINYNANAQRTGKILIAHNQEIWQITINKKEVKEIRKSFKNGQYIANTITLNIPVKEKLDDPTPEADFYYDEKKSELVIRSLNHFDITDGYHRYIAMAQIYDEDETFDYPMELRVTNFTEAKAREEIWQEDQKTRMSKVDSNTMTTRFVSNRIVDKLNSNPTSNWQSAISRNGGAVDYGQLSQVIDFFYRRGERITKGNETTFTLRTTAKIEPLLNAAVSADERLQENVDFEDLMILFYCMKKYGDDPKEMVAKVKKGLDSKSKLSEKFKRKVPTKTLVRELDGII